MIRHLINIASAIWFLLLIAMLSVNAGCVAKRCREMNGERWADAGNRRGEVGRPTNDGGYLDRWKIAGSGAGIQGSSKS